VSDCVVMVPVVAIVGRPNVGKSTLFNRLTKSRDALVANIPGLTRDRQYGEGMVAGRAVILIDTGGLAGEEEGVESLMAEQVWLAVDEADVVLFLVDARDGMTVLDEEVGERLRRLEKPVLVVVNKVDGTDEEVAKADFCRFPQYIPLAHRLLPLRLPLLPLQTTLLPPAKHAPTPLPNSPFHAHAPPQFLMALPSSTRKNLPSPLPQ